jgi:hypothetical protein
MCTATVVFSPLSFIGEFHEKTRLHTVLFLLPHFPFPFWSPLQSDFYCNQNMTLAKALLLAPELGSPQVLQFFIS